MRKDRFAEWLLELVTTRERAAPAVGDLREMAASRGEVWFWWNVCGAAVSQLWSVLAADPRRMIGLAFRGWMVSLGLGAFVTVAGVFVAGVIFGATTSHTSGVGFTALSVVPPFIFFMAVSQFLVGRWIGRRAPGRELPACLTFAILQAAMLAIATLGPNFGTYDSGESHLVIERAWFLLTDVSCFLGAFSVRRRART
jgi:hypothetical protein